MTETNQPAKRGRPKKQKASDEAIDLFKDPVPIPIEERNHVMEFDVEDLFGDIEDDDIRTGKSSVAYSSHEIRQQSPYAKKVNVSEQKVEVETEGETVDKTITSPKVEGSSLEEMLRAEEMAAELVRTRGRFIEGVDNAKAGVPFRAVNTDIHAPDMPLPYADQPVVRADGIVLADVGVLDTGQGAQGSDGFPERSQRDDPSSLHFMVCVNKQCRYREGCLRYRLHNKRDMKSVFYPEDCRRDGIYISVDETDFQAYDPMSILESTSTPSL